MSITTKFPCYGSHVLTLFTPPIHISSSPMQLTSTSKLQAMPHYTDELINSSSSSSSVPMNYKPNILLEKKESMGSEKQISVDPISLRDSAPPNTHNLLPKLSKSSSKFLSCSLPSSASSSPRFDSNFSKQKKKSKIHVSPLARQHSVALSNLERLRENHLRRSKSCGEGRACQPSDDFDLFSTVDNKINIRRIESQLIRVDKEEEEKIIIYKGGEDMDSNSYEDKFKCGACLFLPGFGKGKIKAVRARKEAVESTDDIVSQRVSLEKFECGSWRSSSAIIHCDDDGETTASLFFDLPVELIRCSSVNDAMLPVTAGFVFDNIKDSHHHRKGVLKSTMGGTNSSRHVRFSTSSPSLNPGSPSSACVTPRLLNGRDDFSTFLEAQSA